MATTCDFPAIKNPLDEAMRTCFICAINNEAVLKSVFRKPEEKLTFSKAVDIATEVEEAAKTAKAQVYSKPEEVHKIQAKKQYHHHQKLLLLSTHSSLIIGGSPLLLSYGGSPPASPASHLAGLPPAMGARFYHQKSAPSSKQPSSTQTQCYCCGKKGHAMKDCRLSNPVCKFCGRKGHIEAACITKQKSSKVSLVTKPAITNWMTLQHHHHPYQLPSTTGSFHSWWIQAHPVTSCPDLHGRRLERRDSRRMRPAL